MSQINLSQDFAVPAERVYDALADQDGMSAWMGSKISVPVRGEGGLVGTVRRIHAGPVSFDERIVEAQRPSLIAYTICSPMPLLVKHRGELRIAPIDARRSRVTWQVELVMKSAIVGAAIRGVLTLALGAALKRLAAKLR
ncbi:MAG: Polyketide cyclase / dehydrase and lipid transport [Pseudomonadota bacterium]